MNNRYGCCIGRGQYHQRCVKSGLVLSHCKELCDADSLCKGYVTDAGSLCQLATTFNCPSSWEKHDVGNVEDLNDSACGYSLNGCYIKDGKHRHSIHS